MKMELPSWLLNLSAVQERRIMYLGTTLDQRRRVISRYRPALTQVKAALVNARLLGFLCLDLCQLETYTTVQTNDSCRPTLASNSREVNLAAYMRSTSSDLSAMKHETQKRFDIYRDNIRSEIASSNDYPWRELLQLRPDKFYSDIVESVLGAVLIDAKGSLLPCQAFIEKLGLQAYMKRLVDEEVDISPPRERVQRCVGASHVTYDVQVDELDQPFRCSVLVDNVEVVRVAGCSDRDDAITQAAYRAEEVLGVENAAVQIQPTRTVSD